MRGEGEAVGRLRSVLRVCADRLRSVGVDLSVLVVVGDGVELLGLSGLLRAEVLLGSHVHLSALVVSHEEETAVRGEAGSREQATSVERARARSTVGSE